MIVYDLWYHYLIFTNCYLHLYYFNEMNAAQTLQMLQLNIPPVVRKFLLKAFVVFAVWKLLYHLLLVPASFPDKPLTHFTAISTAGLYAALSGQQVSVEKNISTNNSYSSTSLFINNKKIVGIADPCNGLELFITYIGFLLCIPERLPKKLLYILGGILCIYILNCFRCAGIAWLNIHFISASDLAHHYVFKIIIYALIFFAWVRFSKNYFQNAS